ncbi:MAG TPA: signal peptidase I [Verrucomicrobiae bacterium]|nr:signal peptidase I [Verrucomicrobiae bacterium]
MTNELPNHGPSLQLRMVSVPETKPAEAVFPAVQPKSRFNLYPFWRQAASLVLVALLSVGSYAAISRFLLETVRVEGVSMTPTLQENNHYLLNRWAFHDRDPQRLDIVVLRDPSDNGYAVKRVIATAGDSIFFKDGRVFVNGKRLEEPYLAPGTATYTNSRTTEQLITCGKDQYFVLGDNRTRSIDSRMYGPVPRENILGQVVVK